MNLLNKIKSHYVIFVLALLFGLFCSLPQYLATKNVPNFQGIYHINVDDYSYYETRVRDVIDGHTFLSNPYFAEHKGGFPMQTWLTDYMVAKPIGLFNLSVPVGFMIWEGVIVSMLLLFTYLILYVLTYSKKWSILGVVFLYVFMFGDMNINILGFEKRLALFGDFFLRLPSPAFNFLFWLTTALSTLFYIKEGNSKYGIVSAISFGLLFYVYPYYWTFYFVLFSIYIFLTFILKPEDVSYKKLLHIFFGGLVIAIPYFISTWKSTKMPFYDESLIRLGMIHSHFPSGITNVFFAGVIALIFIYQFWIKKLVLNGTNLFLFSGVVTTAVVVNQHIITGKNLEFVNHYYLQNTFWIVFASGYLFWNYIKSVSVNKQRFIFWVFLVTICFGSFYSLVEIREKQYYYKEDQIYKQNYAPVFKWLNNNAKKDEVVLANNSISDQVTVYTSQNVYSSPFGILFFLSDKEVEERYLINHYFDNFTDEYIISNHRKMLGGYYVNEFGHMSSVNKVRKILGLETASVELFPKEKIEYVKNMAKEIKSKKFEDVVKTYKVDYIIWDKNKDLNWNLDKFRSFKEVYSANNIVVYKISS